MDIISDIAFAFKWSKEEIENIPFDELEIWHELAKERLRWQTENSLLG